MQPVKIFLASSSELAEDRKEFRLAIADRNDSWLHHGVLLQVVAWEQFLDAMSRTRLQDEYNRALLECDLFVMLFWTKVGMYTREEFETAFGNFSARGHPFVYTYFKKVPPAGEVPAADRDSLAEFQARLKSLGHFQTGYDSTDRLNLHFFGQLDRLAAARFIEFTKPDDVGVPADRRAAPFQAPPVTAEHVARPVEVALLKSRFVAADGRLQLVDVGLHGMGGVGKTTLARLLCADPTMIAACRDGILWTAIGTRAGDALERLESLVVALTADATGCTTLEGARGRLQAALAGRQVLLVVDDIWDDAHVRDLLDASTGCARLLTTRRPSTLPFGTLRVDVDTMSGADASALLGLGLPVGHETQIDALAVRLGRWPVLLRLANRRLREQIAQGQNASAALDAAAGLLARRGILAFDIGRDVAARDQAVATTVEASLALLTTLERERFTELAVFPQDVAIPLAQAVELWRITAGWSEDDSCEFVAGRLATLSLLDYDAGHGQIGLHDVLRRYLLVLLGDRRAALHARLADHWTDHPSRGRRYAWRWLAHHRAQAAIAAQAPDRHTRAAALVALVADSGWQEEHQAALQDLPALRDALARALDAAVADDTPAGLPVLVRAADACVQFGRDHERAAPVFELARRGEIDFARRRAALFTLDAHWRQALLLTVVWLAPRPAGPSTRTLFDEMVSMLADEPALADLVAWVRADLDGLAPPAWAPMRLPGHASPALIEQLLARLGGDATDAGFLHAHGIDTPAINPDMQTRGLAPGRIGSPDDPGTPSQYLAQQDGPWLVAFAADDPVAGRSALDRYLSVFAGYGYAEYRQSSCWWLLAAVLRFPGTSGAAWVREAIVAILETALGGGSVQFDGAVQVAARAFAAQAGDAAAAAALRDEAARLATETGALKSGRDASDTWGRHKRLLSAHAEALGWLVGDATGADALLSDALSIADSGFAGYQAPACLTLAETVRVLREGEPPLADPRIDGALHAAEQAAHNVQDPTFCARTTARVNAMHRHWWPEIDPVTMAQRLRDGAHGPEFNGLHHVGELYAGRRPGALPSPAMQFGDRSLPDLQRLYKQPWEDMARLHDPALALDAGDDVSVPDPGLAPLAAARLAAELLARADGAPLAGDRLQALRTLVPTALPNQTALDTVLARLVLACARCDGGPNPAEAAALHAVLMGRPADVAPDRGIETLQRLPA